MKEPSVKKRTLYERESNLLKEIKDFSENETLSKEEYIKKIKGLCDDYEDLLDQCKLITKVSDRLQNKINTANDKLEENNQELQQTISALTKAKIGRRATTYVLIITIIIFIITEWKVEPIIEDWVEHKDWSESNVVAISLALKSVFVLFLKPIEMIVERALIKKAQKVELSVPQRA